MSEEETENSGENLTWLNDVPLKLTVELGQGKITIRDLLKLKDGSIIDLDKLAGEPLELFVNDKLVSRGEVVVSNDHYAIRLTDVISDVDTKESEE